MNLAINFAVSPYIAIAVFGATAVTDAAYVFFNAAVVARHRIRAANWSSVWYMLSAFSVISYTEFRSMWYSPPPAPGSAPMRR